MHEPLLEYPWVLAKSSTIAVKTENLTLARDTRALGCNSRWYVASFAIAVTTKPRSLDCDDFLNDELPEPRVDSFRPRRLPR